MNLISFLVGMLPSEVGGGGAGKDGEDCLKTSTHFLITCFPGNKRGGKARVCLDSNRVKAAFLFTGALAGNQQRLNFHWAQQEKNAFYLTHRFRNV